MQVNFILIKFMVPKYGHFLYLFTISMNNLIIYPKFPYGLIYPNMFLLSWNGVVIKSYESLNFQKILSDRQG